MAKLGWAIIAFVCLGPPFYWGTLHNGVLVPLVWAVLMASVLGLRKWGGLDGAGSPLFGAALVVSAAACIASFYVGHYLGQAG